jgi:hypothetical protein
MSIRRWVPAVIAALALGAVVTPGSAAEAAPTTYRRPAIVTLGDSYVSGEAGRWKGNSPVTTPGHAGTDRALAADGTADPARIYGTTTANGCHRSDVAPVRSAGIPGLVPINLACSGARTVNLLRASAGGVAFKGEAPQDDQLAEVARTYDVRTVALAIGGNDLGFGRILQACVGAYLTAGTPCSTTQAAAVEAALPQVQAAVEGVVADVRATMAAAGYRAGSYRLIVQSYPTPQPATSRYPGTERATVGACPFYDVDLAYAHDTLGPGLTGAIRRAAASTDAQFLDLSGAVAGHELCAPTAQQSDGSPTAATDEWIRFIDRAGQGDGGESLHPNYFGQKALGRCLALATLTRRDVACRPVPRSSTMYLTGLQAL